MTDDAGRFEGSIGRTYHDSRPWWPDPVRAPADAPNIVFIVLDDVGFAHLGCYGSDIVTPVMDRLAANGLQYTGFTTTAMCSPTRASLLTGRHHHAAGVGTVAENATGFPGYRNYLSKRAGTLAEMLGPNGYSSFAVGKWHLMPLQDATPAGPFTYWPTQRGFDRWYGFPGGYTDQWHPELYDGTNPVEVVGGPGYHLSEDLIDHAIGYVGDQQQAAPDRPFFLYVAFGACHWPHQVPAEYVEKYRGRYDAGWDATRERWLARQKALGVVPSDTPLAARDPEVPAWDELTPDERRLAARHMEVYAGFLEHTDVQIGRLVTYLEETGQLENTLIALISDNGASDEGGRVGCVNVDAQYQGDFVEGADAGLPALDRLGDETTNPHYPTGWAQAGNTPLKWYKKDVHGGGVRDPLIVHWPRGITRPGLRHQYHHVVDLAPTVLDVLGIEAPADVKGTPQLPVHGTSLAYSFDAPATPTRKEIQYYEMLGDRAIWHQGWKAVARHALGTDFDGDRWELYHLAEDYGESRDLAAERPEKLREMIERWWAEAGTYDVLPLDDRSGAPRGSWGGQPNPRREFRFRPGAARIERWNTPNVCNRSFSIVADVDASANANGVLLAAGSRFGGYGLFVIDGCLTFEYNAGHTRYIVQSATAVPADAKRLAVDVVKTGHLQARATLTIDGSPAGSVDLDRTWPINPARAGLYCGRDGGSPVSDSYACPFRYGGRLCEVVVTLGNDQALDPAAERKAALAED